VLSDTHLKPWQLSLPPTVVSVLNEVDLVLHAGDIASLAAYEWLAATATVEAVCGNSDESALKSLLPRTRVVGLGGFRIGLVHGDGFGVPALTQAKAAFAAESGPGLDCVIYGHSHRPALNRIGSTIYLNPGSATDPRWSPEPTYALIDIGATLDARLVTIS
jgi:putative phosphoesterase